MLNPCVNLQSNLAEFWGWQLLMQIKQRIFKCLLCKFVVYSLQHSETFDVLHVFLPFTIAELSTLKQVRFFWPTLYVPARKYKQWLIIKW